MFYADRVSLIQCSAQDLKTLTHTLGPMQLWGCCRIPSPHRPCQASVLGGPSNRIPMYIPKNNKNYLNPVSICNTIVTLPLWGSPLCVIVSHRDERASMTDLRHWYLNALGSREWHLVSLLGAALHCADLSDCSLSPMKWWLDSSIEILFQLLTEWKQSCLIKWWPDLINLH